jgi:hypothetical protein
VIFPAFANLITRLNEYSFRVIDFGEIPVREVALNSEMTRLSYDCHYSTAENV